jgi:hypothetical protein
LHIYIYKNLNCKSLQATAYSYSAEVTKFIVTDIVCIDFNRIYKFAYIFLVLNFIIHFDYLFFIARVFARDSPVHIINIHTYFNSAFRVLENPL